MGGLRNSETSQRPVPIIRRSERFFFFVSVFFRFFYVIILYILASHSTLYFKVLFSVFVSFPVLLILHFLPIILYSTSRPSFNHIILCLFHYNTKSCLLTSFSPRQRTTIKCVSLAFGCVKCLYGFYVPFFRFFIIQVFTVLLYNLGNTYSNCCLWWERGHNKENIVRHKIIIISINRFEKDISQL